MFGNKVELYSLQIYFTITESLTLPTYKGFKIYGIMGEALRQVFCSIPECKDCSKCSEKYDCRFAEFFHSIKKDVSGLPNQYEKYSKLPARFSINPPLNKKHIFNKDETLRVDLNYIGNIFSDFLMIAMMLENMKNFKPDYKSNGRFKLQYIKNKTNDKIVYEKGKFHSENLTKYLINFDEYFSEKYFQLEFVTPTRLTYKGNHIMDEITGEILTERIRERAMLLLMLHSDVNDFPEIKKDAIEILGKRLFWREYQHRSNRQHNVNKYGGFVGRMKIKINDPNILPYLKLLEFMRLGSNVKAGYGKFEIFEM